MKLSQPLFVELGRFRQEAPFDLAKCDFPLL